MKISAVAPLRKGIPRIIEAVLALAGLVALSPLLGLGALMVALSSPGPILYRQERVGRHGKKFILYKFRSMRAQSAKPMTHGAERIAHSAEGMAQSAEGMAQRAWRQNASEGQLQITAKGDERITWAGKLLRKTKIDELPELWNVLKGDMSFVGPRPEVQKYVDMNDPLWKQVLAVRPGITDPVTLSLRNEEELLARVEGDRQQFYLETLQPLKLKGYTDYLRQRTAWRDVMVIVRTLFVILFPDKAPASHSWTALRCHLKRDLRSR